ncbi:MAG: DUF559 domain-containing protein [Solirubrobacterales bacterium]|nr:DUF559 domain-containing protein [Solirubrobacterales bacterium]
MKIDVTVPGRARPEHGGIKGHRSATLAPQDITRVNNIPCTTVARTLFELAELIPRRPLERAFDQSDVLELFDLRAIEDQVSRNPTRAASRIVNAVLKEHYIGSTLTQSELEEAMLVLSRAVKLPRPDINVWLDLGDGEPMIKADFLWRAQRLIIETDGHKYHGTPQAFERDRRRDQRAAVAGWRVVRTTDRQIKRRPGELHATVRALLAQAPPGAPGSPVAAAGQAPQPR